MRDQVWTVVRTLAENEGITFNDCLSLTLPILHLLLQIPVDVSFQMQIPLIITYCLESSIYRRWHSEQGRVSPLHKEVRACQTLTKVLGRITCQQSEGVGHPPSPAVSDNSAELGGHGGSRAQSCSPAQSIISCHSQRSGSSQSQVTDDGQETSSKSELSHEEEDAPP